jgi:hypothetical protein
MTARTWATETRRLLVLAFMCVLICLSLLPAGCGLQTDQANEYLQQATKHQEEAEAILLRFKAFPNDWQNIFSAYGIGQGEVDRARQLIQGREQDLVALDKALKAWEADLKKISKLDVEMEIKEYVRLKIQAIDAWRDYAELSLKPLIAAYSGMVDIIASGGSAAQQDAKAQEITALVSESVQRLEECQAAERQAEDYFKQNKLGRQ